MFWWYYQEYGTALYAEKATDNPVGYFVRPVGAKALSFYDRAAGNVRLTPETFVFGIPAHHMITDILPEIRKEVCKIIGASLKEDMSAEQVRTYMLSYLMPSLVEMIAEQFAVKLSLPIRPNGRLSEQADGAQTAADEFRLKATYKETSS